MIYQILADVVAAIHLAYVSYVVVGELLIVIGIPLGWQWIRNLWFRVSHLVMMLIVALEAVVGFECPLTTWEDKLLLAAGVIDKSRSVVGRLLHNMFLVTPEDSSWERPRIYRV